MYQTSNTFDGTICLNCAAGYAFDDFHLPCTACSAGRYQSQNDKDNVGCTGWKTCKAGEKGTVPSDRVDRSCSNCDDGKYQTDAGHTGSSSLNCNFCSAGFSFASKTEVCADCGAK